jgi:hypothetical protein
MAPRKELAAQLALSDFIARLFVFGLPSSRSRVYRKKNERTKFFFGFNSARVII